MLWLQDIVNTTTSLSTDLKVSLQKLPNLLITKQSLSCILRRRWEILQKELDGYETRSSLRFFVSVISGLKVFLQCTVHWICFLSPHMLHGVFSNIVFTTCIYSIAHTPSSRVSSSSVVTLFGSEPGQMTSSRWIAAHTICLCYFCIFAPGASSD